MTSGFSLFRTLLSAFPAVAVLAPTLLAAPIVRSIEIENTGVGQVDRSHVLAHTTTAVGDPLDRRIVSRDVKALLATGRFSTVDADARAVEDGVQLVYSIRNKYRLANKPVIVGSKRFSRRRIRKWLDLHPGDFVDDRVLGSRTRKVIDEYRTDHYPAATCTWTFETVDAAAGAAILTVFVNEGEVSYVKKIILEGNDSVSSSELRKALKRPSPFNVFRWFWRRKYEGYEIDGIETDVRKVYLDRGFLDVEVDVDVSHLDKKGRRVAKVTVREGNEYRLSSLATSGISVFPEADVNSRVRLSAGDTASMGAIGKTARDLQLYYGNRGYLGTDVRVSLVPDSRSHTVAVKYLIEEGSLVNIRNVVIRGNTRTRDKVIRRELLVYPGDIYNQTRVSRSERRLQNLGFFETVRALPEITSRKAERDLVFEVEEKRTGQFMLGAGYSSDDKVMGFVELQQGNFDISGWPFTGGGQKLRLRTQVSSTRRDYELSFTEPWFLDRRLSLGFDVYRRDRDYSDYDEVRTGASVALGKALPGANRINLRYRLERIKITDVADTNIYYEADTFDFATETGIPFSFENNRKTESSSLRLTLTHDTRNSPYIPSSGNRLSVFYDLTGGPLGFDVNLYDVGLRTSHYISPWFGHVISLRTRFEFVEAFGSTKEVPLSERLFLGGGRTLRGFDYREVGPKVLRPNDEHTGYIDRTQGGRSLAELKLEYTVPVVTGIRLAAFYDTGNVWRDQYHVDMSDLANSAGLGIRFDMPGFPIRIDYAWVTDRDDQYTGTKHLVLWIGYDN